METHAINIYSPFDAKYIRFLGLNKDILCSLAGQLEYVKIDQAPSYSALSYCWGTLFQQNIVLVRAGDCMLSLITDLVVRI